MSVEIKMNNGDEFVVKTSLDEIRKNLFDAVGKPMKVMDLGDKLVFCDNISTIEELSGYVSQKL
ncbi:hypothetical protein [Paenibacillus lautus]|uniref:hypothetical protein n=1 Tax=Paenibacillus lautus TaxID=1401 RepID=UPI003D2B5A29